MSQSVYLLDVDGVLLYPGGYREALRRTINHFSSTMGWGDCSLKDETALIFEAHGITNEWDMSAICLASLFVEAWKYVPGIRLPESVPDALMAVRKDGVPSQIVNFAKTARNVASEMGAGEYASLAAPRVFARDLKAYPRDDSQRALTALLNEILLNTRDINRSQTLVVLQTFALGSTLFEETYSVPAPFDTGSSIVDNDRRVISQANCEYLLQASKSGEIKSAVFTARPSLPPLGVTDATDYYSPEAELAVQMLGIEALPLIGYGRIQWLAREFGRDPNFWIKPSPIHALAAIGAAVSGDEKTSLIGAHALVEEGIIQVPFLDFANDMLNVTVFEDSASGVQSTKLGLDILRDAGVKCQLVSKGIGVHPEKSKNLKKVGARVFADVNAALSA